MTGFNSKREAAADKLQEPMKCLDCGSHNVGIPATYDSLVNSVKAQPAQEPVKLWLWKNFVDGKLITGWIAHDESEIPQVAINIRSLYTTPPQRPWVGLTDEEIASIPLNEHTLQTAERLLKKKNG